MDTRSQTCLVRNDWMRSGDSNVAIREVSPGWNPLLALLRAQSNGLVLDSDTLQPPLVNDVQTHKDLDTLAQEIGNFTTDYVESFNQAINQNLKTPIPCLRYVWSSCHHHLGRVEAAIDLMGYLEQWRTDAAVAGDDRILIFAHGHAGQVVALLSNLLSKGEAELRPRVFEILANYWTKDPAKKGRVDQLENIFSSVTSKDFLGGGVLDVVTLGTPVRHGWDTDGVGHLLHIINHRPIRHDGKKWLSKMELPGIAFEMPYLMGGDYVQQLAIAGTDAMPATSEGEQANLDFPGTV